MTRRSAWPGMVISDEIDPAKDLEGWLNALPQWTGAEKNRVRQIEVALSFRAAARVFPLVLPKAKTDRPDDYLETLRAFRALVALSVACTGRRDVIHSVTNSALGSELSAMDAVFMGAVGVAWFDSGSVSTVSAVEDAIEACPDGTLGSRGPLREEGPLNERNPRASVREAVASDAMSLGEGGDVLTTALWPRQNPLKFTWVFRSEDLANAHGDWSPVIAWYEHLLDPKDWAPNQDMLAEIAEIRNTVWAAGPTEALPAIGEIWARYQVRSESTLDEELARSPRPDRDEVERIREQVSRNRGELRDTIEGIQELIVREVERLQTNNHLNAESPSLCRSLIGSYIIMYDALDRISALVPESGSPSEAEAEEIIGLGRLYWSKLSALPRDRADEVVQKVWETGGGVVDLGLVTSSSALLMALGFPPLPSIALGAMAFGRKHCGQIISSAKDYLKGGS